MFCESVQVRIKLLERERSKVKFTTVSSLYLDSCLVRLMCLLKNPLCLLQTERRVSLTILLCRHSTDSVYCASNEDAISSNWFQLVHRHDLFQLDGLHSVAVE